jgi:hypothetical protein
MLSCRRAPVSMHALTDQGCEDRVIRRRPNEPACDSRLFVLRRFRKLTNCENVASSRAGHIQKPARRSMSGHEQKVRTGYPRGRRFDIRRDAQFVLLARLKLVKNTCDYSDKCPVRSWRSGSRKSAREVDC